MTSRLLMTLQVVVAPPQKLGAAPPGTRVIAPITSGHDIYMRFQGLRHRPPDAIAALGHGEVVDPARYYFRTLPSFETAAEKYAFLNRIITVAVGEARPDGAVHRIEEIL